MWGCAVFWRSLTYSLFVIFLSFSSQGFSQQSGGSGKSIYGEELRLLRFPTSHETYGAAKHKFYIQSRLHGNETGTTTFTAWLMNRISEGKSLLNQLSSDVGESVTFDFLPIANPDGAKSESRLNANQVDLNRNFGVMWGRTSGNPGASAFSEPETAAIKQIIEKGHYTAAVDVHGYVNWVVAPSSYQQVRFSERQVTFEQRYIYASWIKSIKSNLTLLNSYEIKTAGGLGDGGAFEDWAFWRANTLAFCLEVQEVKDRGNLDAAFEQYERFLYASFKSAIQLKTTPTASEINDQNTAVVKREVVH